MSSKSARRRARELALQGVYQWLLSGSGITQIEDQTTQLTGFDKADAALFKTLLRGTIGAANTLEGHFSPYLDRSVAELSPIERAVLLLGTYELAEQIEVPYKVVINEAIELTKSFGGTDGHRFVNGVLDKVAGQLRTTEVAARNAGGKKSTEGN